jgi:hypothetical protein
MRADEKLYVSNHSKRRVKHCPKIVMYPSDCGRRKVNKIETAPSFAIRTRILKGRSWLIVGVCARPKKSEMR